MATFGRSRREGIGKLSGPALLVLTSLAAGPKHGYALMKDIESFSGLRLGPGTLHGAIGRLHERGLIAALAEEDEASPRRPYEMTEEGVALLRETLDELVRVTEEGRARLVHLPEVRKRLDDVRTTGGVA